MASSALRDDYGGGSFRVGIVGAGVSGLTACKNILDQGLDCTVFEGKPGLGGVWRSSYSSTHLQTPKQGYQFADFPWPESVPTFPSHHQVVDYLESYASHFELLDKIWFNSQVIELKKKETKSEVSHALGFRESSSAGRGSQGIPAVEEEDRPINGESEASIKRRLIAKQLQSISAAPAENNAYDSNFTWHVRVRTKAQGADGQVEYADEWLTFDYLVMCCGRFGDVPKVPSFPLSHGPDVFGGQVLHSLHYAGLGAEKAEELVRGKKVVVVGFQKTSLDVAVEVAETNKGAYECQPCTLLFRRAYWMYPRHRQAFGLFSFAYLWSTRLSEYVTPKPGQRWLQCVLQNLLNPVRILIWKMLEYHLLFTVPVRQYGLVPGHSLFQAISACVLPQLPKSLLGHLKARRIEPKKTPYWDFYAKGVRLADGAEIEADVVILCTGYDGQSKLQSVLPDEYKYDLFEPDGILALYRGIIHPRIPNMAFIGYLEGLSSMHSSEIGAIWLSQLLRNNIFLPDVGTMELDRRSWIQHARKSLSPFPDKACVAPIQIWHTDKLCKDMGKKFKRKRTWWQELFSIYGSSDYWSLTSNNDKVH